MTRRFLAAAAALLAAVALSLSAPRAFAGDPPGAAPAGGVTVQVVGKIDVNAAGDGAARVEVRFPADRFPAVKASHPDPRQFLQDVRSNRADYEVAPDARAEYADAAAAVVITLTELGAARDLGEGSWLMPMDPGTRLVGSTPAGAPRTVATIGKTEDQENGVRLETTLEVALPRGATEANFDPENHVLTWKLAFSGGTGPGRLAASMRAKDRLMSSIYKVYGLGADFTAQWVAKTVFKNTGANVVRNVRARYRVDGYSDWSPWDKFAEVVPGETVVSIYYPVLEASIARLRSNTPANVRLEWSYEDADGKKHEDDDARKVVILGVNEYVFSNLGAGESFGTWQEASNNAPLLASWVSRNDPVVKEFASMANKNAGGVGATDSDEKAVAVLKACYDLLRANDFTYQHPPALADKTVSFDVRQVQNVKFPRDVIRDRSGTCIDLAILFASMVNAVGLEPHLALIPGHCFPVVRLPKSGNLVAVETTGVAGGLRFQSAEFPRVFDYGNDELKKAVEGGLVHLVDVRALWTRGMSNPELEDLPADILQKWGISPEGRGTPQGGPEAGATGGKVDVTGQWIGQLAQKLADGSTITYPWVLGIDLVGDNQFKAGARAEATLKGEQGPVTIVIIEYFAGSVQDNALVLKGESKEASNSANGQKQTIAELDTVVLGAKDGKLVGKIGSDKIGWQEFTLTKRQ